MLIQGSSIQTVTASAWILFKIIIIYIIIGYLCCYISRLKKKFNLLNLFYRIGIYVIQLRPWSWHHYFVLGTTANVLQLIHNANFRICNATTSPENQFYEMFNEQKSLILVKLYYVRDISYVSQFFKKNCKMRDEISYLGLITENFCLVIIMS